MKNAAVVLVVTIALVVLWQSRLQRGAPSGEASAIGSLSAIAKAQADYRATAGNGGYASSLAMLATPCPGTESRAHLLSPDLSFDPSVKSHYEISLRRKPSARSVSSDCHGAATYSGYYVTATPLPTGERDRRAFAVDETGTIWFDASGVSLRPPFVKSRTVGPLQ